MKIISTVVIFFSLIIGGAAFVEAKPKPRPKAQASKNSKSSKSTAKNSKNAKNTKNAKSSKNSKASSKNARNNKSSRKDRSARTSRNSRNSRSSRSSRNARTAAPARQDAPPASKVSTSAANKEIIVSVPVSPIRGQARLDAPYVANARLGTVLFASERNPLWYKVQYMAGGRMQTGWIASSTVQELTGADRSVTYQQIADRNYKPDSDFVSSAALVDFLSKVSSEIPADRAAELELKRALAMRTALSRIGRNDRNVSPYVDFLRDHDSEIVYNATSGEYLVSSTLFWNIADKYKGTAQGDEAAWNAARNPLSSDCNSALNCYLFNLRMTDGEYLSQYSSGARSNEAVRNLAVMLEPMVADMKEQRLFKAPQDADGKAELASLVTEIRTIVLRTNAPDKAAVLASLEKINELTRQ